MFCGIVLRGGPSEADIEDTPEDGRAEYQQPETAHECGEGEGRVPPEIRVLRTASGKHGDRNSHSKKNHDSTFMMMKEDAKNNCQTKP